jgi:hypothetical protein
MSESPQPSADQHLLLEDYARTVDVFGVLADIRFKLLAFVPAIVGATVALVSREDDQRLILAVSVLGVAATLGILLYELRNSEVYNGAAHRARVLERQLQLTPSVPRRERHWLENGVDRRVFWPEQAGVFSERFYVPKQGESGFRLFGVLTVKHDRALALVYGAAVGGWLYLLIDASFRLAGLGAHGAFAAALTIAAAGAVVVVGEVNRHEGSPQMRPWEAPRPADAQPTPPSD